MGSARADQWIGGDAATYAIFGAMLLLGGLLSQFFPQPTFIVATAMCGSFGILTSAPRAIGSPLCRRPCLRPVVPSHRHDAGPAVIDRFVDSGWLLSITGAVARIGNVNVLFDLYVSTDYIGWYNIADQWHGEARRAAPPAGRRRLIAVARPRGRAAYLFVVAWALLLVSSVLFQYLVSARGFEHDRYRLTLDAHQEESMPLLPDQPEGARYNARSLHIHSDNHGAYAALRTDRSGVDSSQA